MFDIYHIFSKSGGLLDGLRWLLDDWVPDTYLKRLFDLTVDMLNEHVHTLSQLGENQFVTSMETAVQHSANNNIIGIIGSAHLRSEPSTGGMRGPMLFFKSITEENPGLPGPIIVSIKGT